MYYDADMYYGDDNEGDTESVASRDDLIEQDRNDAVDQEEILRQSEEDTRLQMEEEEQLFHEIQAALLQQQLKVERNQVIITED